MSALPAHLPRTQSEVYVGTSGWAYKVWQPQFFPPKLAQARFLQHYATRLNAVEVNYSFRRFVPESTFVKWDRETPPEFRFCIKAHQAITHFRRLKDAAEPVERFLASLQPLISAGKLGAVLFQLPPHFKADPVLLAEFVMLLPRQLRAAFEFRDASWFSEPIYDVLRGRNLALCLAESDDFMTPDVRTADYSYYRLRKSDYPPQDRLAIARRLHEAAHDGRAVFAFFKHEERPESPLWAVEVREQF